jgi:glycosyltransferase involved in cell wall biosynthesis
MVYNVTKELAKRGHHVVVYTSNLLNLHGHKVLPTGHHIINGVDVFYLRSLWRYKTFTFTPSLFRLLSRKEHFDVIHIHDSRSFQGISTYMLEKTKNIPYVFQPHGSYLSFSPEPYSIKIPKILIDKLISQRIVKKASKIIALSKMEADQYRNIGIFNDKIAIIPNGIDLSEFAVLPPKGSFRKKFNIPDDKKIILYLGRIHKTKGIDLLIKSYAHLVKNMKCNKTVLVLVGPNDGYLHEVKSLAVSLGVSTSIVYTGFIDNEDKLSALVDADIFVTPSFYGFPVTFLEACITGTPIITTNLGDTLEWINGNVGYVTSPNSYDMAKAIYTIISDDELYLKFSKNCINTVTSSFSIKKVVTQLEMVYKELAEN